jgi:hypothetical protein
MKTGQLTKPLTPPSIVNSIICPPIHMSHKLKTSYHTNELGGF